ncbi:MAG: hypothetical protein K0S04_3319 [Herbinix sp.]|jgi:hypothetical protein|nr:hypothetical protein [Herbinix sp.]
MSNSKNTSSKKQGKSSVSDKANNYTYSPKVETPDPKATTTNKRPSSGNIKGI